MVEWSNTTSLSLVISGCAGSNPAWRKIQKYFILIITFGLLLIFIPTFKQQEQCPPPLPTAPSLSQDAQVRILLGAWFYNKINELFFF